MDSAEDEDRSYVDGERVRLGIKLFVLHLHIFTYFYIYIYYLFFTLLLENREY